MEQYEYEEIMDNLCDKHNVTLDSFSRRAMVLMYERLLPKEKLSFNTLCEQVVLKEKCVTLRPNMNLYERVYTTYAKN